MKSFLYANLLTPALAFPLLHRRSPIPKPEPAAYNVVSVDGSDANGPAQIQNRSPEPEPIPASYSVVAVDGGPQATAPPAPATLTETILTTRVSTITITNAEQPTTILVTITEPAAAAAEPTPDPEPQTVTETLQPSTTAGPLTETRPYDNGMWHTTYYYTTVVSPTPAATPSTDASAEFSVSQAGDGDAQSQDQNTDRESWLQGSWLPWKDRGGQ
jgi:hypothetical protein